MERFSRRVDFCSIYKRGWVHMNISCNISKKENFIAKLSQDEFQVSFPFFGPEHWLTSWLTHELLFSKLDWCDSGLGKCQLKTCQVFIVADVDDEDRVGNSLLQIWKWRFGHKIKLLFRLWAKGLVIILKLKFRQDLKQEFVQYFAADVLKW